MGIREVFGFITLVQVGLGLLVANLLGWGWACCIWLWTVLSVTATLGCHSDIYRPRLLRLFAPRRAGAVYRRLMIRFALWPRDWRMYDWALRLALIYPIGVPILLWIFLGWPAELGGVEILRPPASAWHQIAAFGAYIAMFFCMVKSASASKKGSFWKFFGWLALAVAFAGAVAVAFASAVAVAFAFAVAVAFAFAGAVAVAFAFAGTGAFAVAFAGAFAVAFAVAVATAFAVAVASAVEWLTNRGKGNIAHVGLSLVICIAVICMFLFVDWAETSSDQRSAILFLGLLPLLNAIFDYLSYALTFTLLRAGVRHPRRALGWGLFDLGAACVIFMISGPAMVMAVAYGNHLSGVEIYPLAQLFADIRRDPTSHVWVYVMLFSTILPTLLHFGAGTFSLGAWLTPGLRHSIFAMIPSKDPMHGAWTPILIGFYWAICLLVPFAIFWGLYLLVAQFHPYPLGGYLTWLEGVACWTAPANCPG